MVLRIGSVVENITELNLNPGERQTATFSVIKDIAGGNISKIKSRYIKLANARMVLSQEELDRLI